MTPYILNPKAFNFNPSDLYPELNEFFGPQAYVKAIAADEAQGHYWYCAIKRVDFSGAMRYEIYSGLFTKGKTISQREWPTPKYFGLITNGEFAENLLKHLLGAMDNESVETHGKARLQAKCLYLK